MKLLLFAIGAAAALLLIALIRTLLLKPEKTDFSFSKDTDRSLAYGRKLAHMIQYETASHQGKPEVEKFRGFHKVLEEEFPAVFSKLEKIEIDGNIMMKWKGEDSSLDPIVLLSHIDVVPAEGEWVHPPYSGHITDDYRIYGRGSSDVKCGVFSFYQAAEELLKEGCTPKCDVYLGSSCTEETGGDGAPKLVRWFQDHNIHLFMLSDEGGMLVKDPVAGIRGTFAAVGIFEKGYGDLKFTARSTGGHSSMPPKNSPISRLAAFENHIEKHNPFKVRFTEAVAAMFQNLAPHAENFSLKLVLHNLWLFKPVLLKVIPAISKEAAAMLQTTICFTMQSGSDGYNVIPQEAWVTANLRYIPFQAAEESNEIVRKIAAKYDVETETISCIQPSNPLDLNGEPFRMTKECIRKIFPQVGIMPYVVTGGTDSRYFDPVCDSCVRFSPFCIEPDQLASMHGKNENIFVTTLPMAVDYYKELIRIQEQRKDGCKAAAGGLKNN